MGRLFGAGAVLFSAAVVAFEGELRNSFSTEYCIVKAHQLGSAAIPIIIEDTDSNRVHTTTVP